MVKINEGSHNENNNRPFIQSLVKHLERTERDSEADRDPEEREGFGVKERQSLSAF